MHRIMSIFCLQFQDSHTARQVTDLPAIFSVLLVPVLLMLSCRSTRHVTPLRHALRRGGSSLPNMTRSRTPSLHCTCPLTRRARELDPLVCLLAHITEDSTVRDMLARESARGGRDDELTAVCVHAASLCFPEHVIGHRYSRPAAPPLPVAAILAATRQCCWAVRGRGNSPASPLWCDRLCWRVAVWWRVIVVVACNSGVVGFVAVRCSYIKFCVAENLRQNCFRRPCCLCSDRT